MRMLIKMLKKLFKLHINYLVAFDRTKLLRLKKFSRSVEVSSSPNSLPLFFIVF